jgi:hypothetical protein
VDLGTVAVVALVSGLAGGVAGAALVGTVEGMLRQRYAPRPVQYRAPTDAECVGPG